jgi:transketolase N-terminal domain/subunit
VREDFGWCRQIFRLNFLRLKMLNKREGSTLGTIAKKMRVEKVDAIDPLLAEKCIRNIRVLAADIVQKANSGHPGAPMGCAPMAHLLWGEFMNFNASSPNWWDRDRFVLSNGHACALLYRSCCPLMILPSPSH